MRNICSDADRMAEVSCKSNMVFRLLSVHFSMHWVNNLPGTLQQVSDAVSQLCVNLMVTCVSLPFLVYSDSY